MRLDFDEYAHLGSPLHRWDPRYKLVALFLLILAFSLVRDWRLLPAMAVSSGLIYALSRLPLSFLLVRLRSPGFFLLSMAIFLPFLSGQTVLFRLGPLTLWREGCLHLLLVATKFVCILTVSFVLFGTASFFTTVKAMRSLGLPAALADMVLFSYRYIFRIGDDLERMQTAIRLRGFRGRQVRGMGILASLVGSILVRSYEQTDRVYKAMILRGYGQALPSPAENRPRGQARPHLGDEFRTRPGDLGGLVAVLLVAVGFVIAEMWLRQLGGMA